MSLSDPFRPAPRTGQVASFPLAQNVMDAGRAKETSR